MNTHLEEFKRRSLEIDKKFKMSRIVHTEIKDVIHINERWKIYYFTLPPRFTKVVALGFESRAQAYKFMESHYLKDPSGNQVERTITDTEDNKYRLFYDVVLEDTDISSPYSNPTEITTVGNSRDAVLEKWLS